MNAVIEVKQNGLYPIGEVAKILGKSRKTILRHTNLGFIKCTFSRCNGRKMYRGSELIRYHEAHY